MKRILQKITSLFAIMVLCFMCSANQFPILAVSNQSQHIYGKMNNKGNIYKTYLNTEDKDKEDVYIPIDTEIKYYLNGEEVEIDELKGKSGKIKIELLLTNKEKNMVTINKKEVVMYTPYIVGTSVILKNNKFSNITISSGKIVDNGADSIVVGVAMPGMQESLNLSKSNIEMPENIIIEADTTDFELGNIYMYIESNIFEENSLDFLDELDNIYDDARKLKNASQKLVDGSNSLKNGASTYASKIGEFNSGLSQYTNGVNSINENYSKINFGINTINENTKKIADGSNSLNNGIKELKNKLTTLVGGVVQIKQGTDGIYSGLGQIITGVDGSISKIQDGSMDTTAFTTLVTTTETTIATLEAVKNNLETTASGMPDYFESIESSTDEAGETIYSPIQIENTQKSQIIAQINALSEQIANLKQNISQERGAYSSTLQAVSEKTTELVTGLDNLKTNLQTLQGVSEQVKNGIDVMANSSPELQSGLENLEKGSNSLASGAKELSNGTTDLSNGSANLKSGIEQLNSNSGSLTSAVQQLQDGANNISNGASELANGIQKFDSEGINSIYNLINGDLNVAQERIEKLKELASKNNNITYKYIIKIDSIKK